MRAVVTGGAGFLGSHLCERLLARGLHVVCLDNLITGSAANLSHLTASPSFTLINCDITGFFGIDGEVNTYFTLHPRRLLPTICASRFRPLKPGASRRSMRWK
jgi:nucleoside-diphosphate-sugar epimerase